MADDVKTIILDDFQKRFIKVLESQNAKYWMVNLGIQGNLLWGWKKGNYPGLRYAIEVCLNEGISSNWLLLGMGPQYIEDLDGVNDNVLMNKALKEEVLTTIMGLKKEMKRERLENNEKIKQILSDVDAMKTFKTFSNTVSSADDLKTFINTLPSSILEKLAVPMLGFLDKNAGEITGTFQQYATSDEGSEWIKNGIRWIMDRK